jgi:hypothetical protein
MSIKHLLVVLAGLAVLAQPGQAGQWTETTQPDFSDGDYQANMYSSGAGTGDGALVANPGSCYDLNRDGYADLIISNFWDSGNFDCNSFIYWGSDSGYTIGNRTELPTHGATSNAVDDLNRDGQLDIVFSCFSGGMHGSGEWATNSLIFWGSKDGFNAADTTALPTLGAYGNYICDLNHDGHLDIIFANFQDVGYSFEINSYIYWGSKTGYSVSNRTELPTKAACDVSVADLNKDGRLDIVFCNRQQNLTVPDIFNIHSYIYYGQGTDSIYYSTAARDSVSTHGASSCTIVDLNRDGSLDLVFSNSRVEASYNIHSYIYYGSATGYSQSDMDSLQTHGSYDNAVADLNKDGHLDIVFANAESNFATPFDTSYIYWGPNFAVRSDLPIKSGAGVMVDRIDHDGYLDIVMIKGLDQGYGYVFYGSDTGYSPAGCDSFYTTRGGVSTKDAGNVHNRSLTEIYHSSVFGNESETKEWGTCSWNEHLPAGAVSQVSLRTGNTSDPGDGTWSAWSQVAKSGLPGKASPSKYLQYQYSATANELYQAPALEDISVDYSIFTGVTGTVQEVLKTSFSLQTAGSQAIIKYTLAGPALVSIKAYNLIGQQIGVLEKGMKTAGSYQLNWSKRETMSNGVYIIRAQLGRECFTERMVLVK